MKAVAITPSEALALDRRRRQMNSVITEIIGVLRESMNTGKPFLVNPRWRSLLLQFEAGRVRVEAHCQGNLIDNETEVERIVAALIEEGILQDVVEP
jgi:hypothetical protein